MIPGSRGAKVRGFTDVIHGRYGEDCTYSSVGSKDGHHGLSFETKALKRDKFSDVFLGKDSRKGGRVPLFGGKLKINSLVKGLETLKIFINLVSWF